MIGELRGFFWIRKVTAMEMATLAVSRFAPLHAGPSFRKFDLSTDCTSSGRLDCSAFRVRAAAGNGENAREEDEQRERARKALENLDQQLNTLSESESNGRVPRKKPQPFRTLPGPDSKLDGKIEWPDLNDSFLFYSAGFLFLLTIVNNVLFNLIFKPNMQPVQPRKPLFSQDSTTVLDEDQGKRRFRIKSFREENASAEAPPFTDLTP